jgi:uncharacterized protein YjbI with pentapeptide repeats
VRPPAISADTQVAIFVLARRDITGDIKTLDLNHAYLVGAAFNGGESSKTMQGFAGANFAGATLYGADMHGLDLTQGAFSGSRMADWEAYGASWQKDTPTKTDYQDERYKFTANFKDSILRKAKFDYVWMGGVSFQDADLDEVHFYMNNLSRANFIGARHLSNVTIIDAVMPDACFSEVIADGITIAIGSANRADFGGASLKGAKLERVDFSDAHFDSAKLNDADFRWSTIRGADFTEADLSGAIFEALDFSGATLKGTIFRNAHLRHANFSNAELTNVIFDGADLTDANFDHACKNGSVSFSNPQTPELPNCSGLNSAPPENESACAKYRYKKSH